MTLASEYYRDLLGALETGPPPELDRAAAMIAESAAAGGRLYTFGNGASAALASHLATDMGKRAGVPVVSLVDNAALVTAYGNDVGYEHAYSEQLRTLARAGDVALGISCSGSSPNVVRALESARTGDIRTVGFTGDLPGADAMAACCDVLVRAPLTRIEQIEDLHVVFGHILLGLLA